MVSHINQQSSAVMVELLQALAPHFRAIAIDYPSHCHSDHIDWQPAIEDYARCVIEVMDALKVERAFALDCPLVTAERVSRPWVAKLGARAVVVGARPKA